MNKADKEIAICMLNEANEYAQSHSTCTKTAVGCLIYARTADPLFTFLAIGKGANSGKPNCKEVGCLRVEKFGNNSKEHRNVCRCTHSEVNAIKNAGELAKRSIAVVTRYPCDNCAKAFVEAGIKTVIYGREFPISEYAKKLFADNNIKVIHISDWNCDKKDTNN